MSRKALAVVVLAMSLAIFACSLAAASHGCLRTAGISRLSELGAGVQPRQAKLSQDGRIVILVRDKISGVDPASIRLIIDGREVLPSLTAIAKGYSVSYAPDCFRAQSGEYKVEIQAADRAKNWMRNIYQFRSTQPLTSELESHPTKVAGSADALPVTRLRSAIIADLERGDHFSRWSRHNLTDLERAAIVGPDHQPGFKTALLDGRLFDVQISSQVTKQDNSSAVMCRAIFTVTECDRLELDSLWPEYDLVVGMIDDAGDVTFYEQQKGQRGIPLSRLSQLEDGRLGLELIFDASGLDAETYTWCAAVSFRGSPEVLRSNIASGPLDTASPECGPSIEPEVAW